MRLKTMNARMIQQQMNLRRAKCHAPEDRASVRLERLQKGHLVLCGIGLCSIMNDLGIKRMCEVVGVHVCDAVL